jgi:hypothetical protein
MADRPILFSAPMVLALLAGRKTQTRRLVKIGGAGGLIIDFVKVGTDKETGRSVYEMRGHGGVPIAIAAGRHFATPHYMPPIAVGDHLWVKETFGKAAWMGAIEYRADGGSEPLEGGRWKPSIFMPRTASRLTLIVEDVKIERLQDISEEDAIAEGCAPDDASLNLNCIGPAKSIYANLWDSINGAGSWNRNPWVVAYRFRVIPQNIDQIGGDHG